MSKIDDKTRLKHMLDAAQKVVQYVQHETRETFLDLYYDRLTG
jgi:uncharacterized protein with HEPN domain